MSPNSNAKGFILVIALIIAAVLAGFMIQIEKETLRYHRYVTELKAMNA